LIAADREDAPSPVDVLIAKADVDGTDAVDTILEEQRRRDAEYKELADLLVKTISSVERNYVQDIDRRELFEAAIEGVLKKLDEHSAYIPPEEVSQFRTSVESEFGGLGIQVTFDSGKLQVISPIVDSPAYKAGVISGDWIVAIDGKKTEDLSLDDAVKLMKGAVGTEAKLTVVHPGKTERVEIPVERAQVHVATVLGYRHAKDDRWDFMYDDAKKIGYIRLTAFSRSTADELKEALQDLTDRGMKGLVLDLRFNPGGLLRSAIDVSDLFVKSGKIVSTEGRNTVSQSWDAKEEGTFGDFPMAVLVNGYSASASEIVAACLQDHDRAVIIGERTYGKGSVQNVIEMEHGNSILKLTTASYHRPNGKNIHRFPDAKEEDEWGVLPDDGYKVEFSDREMFLLLRDQQEREIVRSEAKPVRPVSLIPRRLRGPRQVEETPETNMADRQLEKAIEYLTKAIEG